MTAFFTIAPKTSYNKHIICGRRFYNMIKRYKHQLLWTMAILLPILTAIVLYMTHKVVPFMMDDLWYSTMLFSEEPIQNLADIIESQKWHYFNWGGRSLTHGLLQITLLLGESITDVLNVFVTFLLGTIICLVAGVSRNRQGLFLWWGSVAMLLGLNANWKMSMFWQAGAANYLYITVFILFFIWCYLRELSAIETSPAKHLPGITFWIIPLGILAGWSNENMGPTAFLLSILVMFLCQKAKHKISLWMILGSITSLVGSILVIIAPGNFVRSSSVPEAEYGLLWRCFLHCYAECKAALEFLFPVLLLLLLVLIIAKVVLKLTIGLPNLLLLTGALLSWGAMVLSPHYPDRATFGTMVLLICVILSLTRKILAERKDLSGACFAVGSLVWLRGMFFLGEFIAISWGWIK